MRRVFLVLLNVQLAYLSIETSSFCGYLETRFLKKLSWLKTSEDIKDITDRFHFKFFFFFLVCWSMKQTLMLKGILQRVGSKECEEIKYLPCSISFIRLSKCRGFITAW